MPSFVNSIAFISIEFLLVMMMLVWHSFLASSKSGFSISVEQMNWGNAPSVMVSICSCSLRTRMLLVLKFGKMTGIVDET